ncbi:MAG TPA: hypothetical protein VJB57_03555 [Dehalococcoidia bacterium]|nr:hypothetical protein [Dehalococcoidia bacterium]
MDRGIWATWYDLAPEGRDEYLAWLHEQHLPTMLARPGYLWAAHVENVVSPEREARGNARLTHTNDPAVPTGFSHLLLFGALNPHTFVDPSPEELAADESAETRRMLSRQAGARSAIFLEVERVEGPDGKGRRPGITPGPVIQFGSFNINALENETEMSTWYSRSRLPLVQPLAGTVGARKLVSISGWAKHAILYEFTTLEAAAKNLVDPSDWTRRVVDNLVHAPHSPTLGTRIWPPF